MADCVLGVNLATGGYYQILQDGPPLLHFQYADVVTRHPDLPRDAITTVTDPEALRAAIESLLFNEEFRDAYLRKQRMYAAKDFAVDFASSDDPIRVIVKRLIRKPFLHKWRARPSGSQAEPLLDTPIRESSAQITALESAGSVDDILYAPIGRCIVRGWAADLTTGHAAKAVYIFLEERCVTKGLPRFERPDVVAAYGRPDFLNTGYSVEFRLQHKELLTTLDVYAEMADGRFCLLLKSFDLQRLGFMATSPQTPI